MARVALCYVCVIRTPLVRVPLSAVDMSRWISVGLAGDEIEWGWCMIIIITAIPLRLTCEICGLHRMKSSSMYSIVIVQSSIKRRQKHHQYVEQRGCCTAKSNIFPPSTVSESITLHLVHKNKRDPNTAYTLQEALATLPPGKSPLHVSPHQAYLDPPVDILIARL